MVTPKAVTILYIKLPFFLPLLWIFLVGLLLKEYIPNAIRMRLPLILSIKRAWGLLIKSIMKLIPSPVIKAYSISLMAAPNPVAKPYQRPLFSVLWMQRIPTGPIGADAIMPISIPFRIKSNISMWLIFRNMDAKLQKKHRLHKFSI